MKIVARAYRPCGDKAGDDFVLKPYWYSSMCKIDLQRGNNMACTSQ